jgi:hypothetical protein
MSVADLVACRMIRSISGRLLPLFAAAENRADLVDSKMQDASICACAWGESEGSPGWIMASGVGRRCATRDAAFVPVSDEERAGVGASIFAGWAASRAVFNDDFAGTGTSAQWG